MPLVFAVFILVLVSVLVLPGSAGRKPSADFWVFEPGTDDEIRVHALEANDDGIFDVTGLGIV